MISINEAIDFLMRCNNTFENRNSPGGVILFLNY